MDPSGQLRWPGGFESADGLHWKRFGAAPTIDNGGVSVGSVIPGGYLVVGSVVLPTDDAVDVPAFFVSPDARSWSGSVLVPPSTDLDRLNRLAAIASANGRIVVVGGYETGPDNCDTCITNAQVFVAQAGLTP
jgi:hypothetical protein